MPRFSEVRKWMETNIETYLSQQGTVWMVDSQHLAEDACYYFHDLRQDGRVPDLYFDAAHETARQTEGRLNKR